MKIKVRILIVEDEFKIADVIASRLRKENYIVDVFDNGEAGLDNALTNIYDLIILDVMLPKVDGFKILEEIRREKINAKVIMLTAKSMIEDKLMGGNSGANDYLTKPFHIDELVARVNAQLRMDNVQVQKYYVEAGDLRLNIKNTTLICTTTNESIEVVCKEFMLLEYLMKFTTTGDVYVAVYFCTSISKIPADGGTYIPRNGEESYSGTARKFYISTSKTLYAADAMASYYNSYFFGLTPYNGKVTNTNEHNPITLVQGGTASETALNKSDRNLGNWGLQYAMNFTLKNNYSKPVKFKGYIISNPISHCAGIRSGNSVDGVFLEPNESNENPDNNRWQFFESTTLPANTGSVTIDFQYMHLSKGNAPCLMQFEVVPA